MVASGRREEEEYEEEEGADTKTPHVNVGNKQAIARQTGLATLGSHLCHFFTTSRMRAAPKARHCAIKHSHRVSQRAADRPRALHASKS